MHSARVAMIDDDPSADPLLQDPVVRLLFSDARTQNGWTSQPVTDQQLRQIYELMKWGPTSANCSPLRVIFLRTEAAKRRLEPHLSSGNRVKTLTAPVTAILGYDTQFYHHLPRLFAHDPGIHAVFSDPQKKAKTDVTAFRNGTLQAAYFMLAARLVGLDCGPMSGFDEVGVDHEFWAGTAVRTNFLCNLGHGDPTKLFPRLPRLEFDEVCSLL